ncbi:hypothetical protein MPTK1_7g04450 [Marchantia polymorpha subsp. ruderalis]|uniref:Uncharacterized protein n=2 Tax=Marchantia polymorpha TaxID=3197 RepID=A0AAF6BW34_MARPO|nr:hypothetical protein MARPO_0062s0080 [Marchantia polymorpha]BBN16218.1 hypothetical protein Mp_7g04450 [Marchantia polymorpha subsp. ruderalis]|eukprot:PTQ36663.1 hypothetical protein MARPO_0062s0080 [Marchantia polymorpha]
MSSFQEPVIEPHFSFGNSHSRLMNAMVSWDKVNQLLRELAQVRGDIESASAVIENLQSWLENSTHSGTDEELEARIEKLRRLYVAERDRAMREENLVSRTILEIDAVTACMELSEHGAQPREEEREPT